MPIPSLVLFHHNSTASLRASNRASTTSSACKDTVSNGITTRICTYTVSGLKLQFFYTLQGNTRNKYFCATVAGIPCKDSYYCGNKATSTYLDCRNTAVGKTTCVATDCTGKCLPKLATAPSFANGINGCTRLQKVCRSSFTDYGFINHCTFFDILGDGKVVSLWTESLNGFIDTCTASIGGHACSSCSPPYGLCDGLSSVHYDCRKLSKGPCAKKICEVCADKTTKSLTVDQGAVSATNVSAVQASSQNASVIDAENTSPVTPNSTTGGQSSHSKSKPTCALLASLIIPWFPCC